MLTNECVHTRELCMVLPVRVATFSLQSRLFSLLVSNWVLLFFPSPNANRWRTNASPTTHPTTRRAFLDLPPAGNASQTATSTFIARSLQCRRLRSETFGMAMQRYSTSSHDAHWFFLNVTPPNCATLSSNLSHKKYIKSLNTQRDTKKIGTCLAPKPHADVLQFSLMLASYAL